MITRDAGIQYSPSWSPDGSQLTVGSTDSGTTQIWTLNADGSHGKQLTFGLGPDGPDANAPSWSPNGDQIAFWSDFENEYGEVFVMNSDGTRSRRLTTTADPWNSDDPAWAPDGTALVFGSNQGDAIGAFTVDLSGSAPTRIAPLAFGAGVCAWKPLLPKDEH